MRRRTAAILLATGAGLAAGTAATPASATSMTVCAERAAIVERLEAKFSETQRSYGLQGSAGVFEVFASDTGTWTILLTAPSGIACIMAAGEAWTEAPAIEAAMGDPA